MEKKYIVFFLKKKPELDIDQFDFRQQKHHFDNQNQRSRIDYYNKYMIFEDVLMNQHKIHNFQTIFFKKKKEQKKCIEIIMDIFEEYYSITISLWIRCWQRSFLFNIYQN